jgi:hypothetical protein
MKKLKLSTNMILIIVLILLIVITVILFIVFKKKKDPLAGLTTKTNNSGFPLKVGSTGDLVKSLQTFLNKNYNSGLTVDGIFGPLTLKEVQTAFGTNNLTQEVYNKNIGDY